MLEKRSEQTIGELAHRSAYYYYYFDRMMEDADVRLLQAVNRNSQHVLRGLFPPTVRRPNGLRPRPHEYELPKKDYHNFVSRVLFRTIRDVKI